jgi:hypothetical protein
LDFFKTAHDGKSSNLVHCWRVLKGFDKWKVTYATFNKKFKNGKAPVTVDLEEEDGDKGTLSSRPRGHKASKGYLKSDAAAHMLSETFKGWMVDKEEIISKREEKRRWEKEATCAQFDLTKKAIEVEESLAKKKVMEAEAKLLVMEREIMFIDTTQGRSWAGAPNVVTQGPAGAWLTWENVIDVGASYSSSPCQQHQKIPCAW